MKTFSVWATVKSEFLVEAETEDHARRIVECSSDGEIELNDTGEIKVLSVGEIDSGE